MKSLILATTLFATLTMSACSQAASTPEALAKALQTVLDKGDFEAAGQLAELDGAPAQLHILFFDAVRKCASEATCTVSVGVADEAFLQGLKETAEQMHAQAPEVAGTLKVALKMRDGKGSGKMTMPYAKTGNEYKMVSIRFSPAELETLRATTDQSLVDEMFAKGFRDSQGEMRSDWATAATALPADGGEAGKAFVAQVMAKSAAINAKDPDAVMNSGSPNDKIVFRDKELDGTPIPLVDRQRKLHVKSLNMLRDVKVNGGYQLDDDSAILIIEARDGIGWIERGPVLVWRDGNRWNSAGSNTVSYPPAK